MKRCSKCQEQKSLEEFSKNSKVKDGRSSACKVCIALLSKEWRDANAEHVKAYRREYVIATVESRKAYRSVYNVENRDKRVAYQREYEKLHPEQRRLIRNKNARKRKESDSFFRFTCNVRSLMWQSFKNACMGSFSKRSRSVEMLGCSMEDFVSYIVAQFSEGMTLENHGEWHLDHIIPLATARSEEDIVRLNHYTNFQPLWAKDNLSKGAKIL